jgi:hypothetical protein
VMNQNAISAPLGDTTGSSGPVPGAAVWIGTLRSEPEELIRYKRAFRCVPRWATIVPASDLLGDRYGDAGVPFRVTWRGKRPCGLIVQTFPPLI